MWSESRRHRFHKTVGFCRSIGEERIIERNCRINAATLQTFSTADLSQKTGWCRWKKDVRGEQSFPSPHLVANQPWIVPEIPTAWLRPRRTNLLNTSHLHRTISRRVIFAWPRKYNTRERKSRKFEIVTRYGCWSRMHSSFVLPNINSSSTSGSSCPPFSSSTRCNSYPSLPSLTELYNVGKPRSCCRMRRRWW